MESDSGTSSQKDTTENTDTSGNTVTTQSGYSESDLPNRIESTDDVSPPALELEYEHDIEARVLTITHTGGAELTPENTGWVAVFAQTDQSLVRGYSPKAELKEAWQISEGDTGFPMKPGQSVEIDGVDVDQNVEVSWAEPDGGLLKWGYHVIWRQNLPNTSYRMGYDGSAEEVVIEYTDSNDEPVSGAGGVSLALVRNNDFSEEIIITGEDGAFIFPIKPGTTTRVPLEDVEKRDIIDLHWRGPNKTYIPLGSVNI